MPDTFSKKKRSEIMRQVKSSRNRSTELKLIQFFKNNSITGWRRNIKMVGKPDFIFPKAKTTVFVDGCFWHGHGCRNIKPKKNRDYWIKKIKRNKQRDKEVTKQLKLLGWQVLRIWECELKDDKKVAIRFHFINKSNLPSHR